MKGSEKFTKTIKSYLESRGSKDPLFARIITKPGKNIDDCVTYIFNTVQKSGCNGFHDDEIYSMAIHYFTEDNIQIGTVSANMQVVINHKVELTDEEKVKAKEEAIEQYKREHIAKMTKKSVTPMTVKKDEEKPKVENTLF